MPYVGSTRDDGVTSPEWVDDEIDRKRTSPKLIFLLIAVGLIALLFGGTLVQINHSYDKELQKVALIERELRASAQISSSDAINIEVYHYDDGSLVARWNEGDIECTGVGLVPPASSAELWATEEVLRDSGKCISSHSSTGIGN